MAEHVRPALVLIVLFTLITGLLYPFAGHRHRPGGIPAPGQRQPDRTGRPRGRVGAIGQSFTSERYFHGRPRPPATATDAAASSGSNLGPTSRVLIDRVRADVERLRAENPGAAVPTDLVTASGSGLDPHISPAAALCSRYPGSRRRAACPRTQVGALVHAQTEHRTFGLLGEPRVNVLLLNRALDGMAKAQAGRAVEEDG